MIFDLDKYISDESIAEVSKILKMSKKMKMAM